MRELKLDDPRRASSWLAEIRAGEYVAFCRHAASGATLDAEGRTLADARDAACLVFASLDEAEAFGRERIALHPHLQIDVFDSAGRRWPPLLTLLHPSQEHRRPANERHMRVRQVAAMLLLGGAVPLLWYDLWRHEARLILPTFLAINMIVAAIRTLLLNQLLRSKEQTRRERLAEHGRPPPATSKGP